MLKVNKKLIAEMKLSAHNSNWGLVGFYIPMNAILIKNAQYLFVRMNIPQKMGSLLHSFPIVNTSKNAKNSKRGFVKNGIPTNAIKI